MSRRQACSWFAVHRRPGDSSCMLRPNPATAPAWPGWSGHGVLHEFDGYATGPVELLVPGARRTRVDGVIHHRGPMGSQHTNDFTVVDGIRCTGVARTLCDIGSVDSNERVRLAFRVGVASRLQLGLDA